MALDDMSDKERETELDKLRLEGDYNHNIKVLAQNKGSLILPRRPSTKDHFKYSYDDYLPCKYCKAFCVKNNLWRHQKTCKFQQKTATSKEHRGRPQRDAVLLMESVLPQNKQLNQGYMKNVVSSLHVDEVSNIIKKDDIILRVGDFMYDKHAASQRDYISQTIRLLGRLVLSLRGVLGNSAGFLKDFLSPKHFDAFVEAARILAEKEETDDSIVFKKTSVALKCGPALNKCCIILKGVARRESNENAEKEAERFEKLIEDEWSTRVTSVAIKSRKLQKKNEQVLLPTPQDLMKFKDYIENNMKIYCEELQTNNQSMDSFQKLQAAVLCRLIMFNRRRSGETSKILLADYQSRPDWQDNINEEIYETMGTLERKLINR